MAAYWAFTMGFGPPKAMGYGLPQDHGLHSLYQLENGEILWVIKGYGLSEVWVKRVSTIVYKQLR